ncbi:MAG: histidine--tRNA ligase [Cytophagales bacterium]|nr:histidine--tRNA ligase [Cytophagales bacterium]
MISRIKDALFDFLKYIIKDHFTTASDPNDRSAQKIKDVLIKFHQREAWISSRYLSGYQKEIFKTFIEEDLEFLSISLSEFLNRASLYKENFDSNFDHHFRQFRDNDFNNRVLPKALKFITSKVITSESSEKGLRYDLTVPFARYVVMNRHEITFPFKRYQIQPVWRADRPQKGRYREFYQCDADVVGTDSLICEAEIILMIKEVFKGLGITDYSIKLNHRAILSGLAEICKGGNETSLFVAIDKLDKIGEEKVKEELRSRGFADESLTKVFNILNFKGNTSEKLQFITQKFANSEAGKKGISDLTQVLQLLKDYNATEDHVEFDIALARGLSYYTGCIFEVKINKVAIGSVSGGGRYDNLTGGFGLPNVSGVGFSFGVDRLYDSMEELKLFPQKTQISSKVLIAHFDAESKKYGLGVLQQLRAQGIASEIYPDAVKIQKQLDYANKKLIPYVIVIGSEEVKSGLLAFKNMKAGEQQKLSVGEIINLIK